MAKGRYESALDLFKDSKRITVDVVNKLEDMGFFTAPASTKFHGNYEGGLFDHSAMVAKELIYLTEKLGLVWQDEESPLIIGLLHDLCKVDNYEKLPEPIKDGVYTKTYNYRDSLFKGHGDKSLMYITHLITLTQEEIACIRFHMGAFSDDANERNAYGKACEMFPNVLYTHTADMIASKIDGV